MTAAGESAEGAAQGPIAGAARAPCGMIAGAARNPHVIITGAAGFIGAACTREFLARGFEVTAVAHRRPRARFRERGEAGGTGTDRLSELRGRDRLSLVVASITEGDDLLRVLSERIATAGGECRAVVHCAGRATDVGFDRLFRRANLEGTENICRAVRQLGIGRLIQMSTTDVYGVRDFSGADENTPLENNRRNPYPKYKILAERAIQEMLPRDRYVILRPALVWGPGDATVAPRAVSFLRSSPAIIHFGRWRGRNRWPLAYVGNVARVSYAAAISDDAAGKAYNIVDPDRATMEEYYRLLIDLFLPDRAGLRSVTIPLPLAWPAAALSTALSALLGRDRPLFDPTLYGLRHVAHNQEFSGAEAERLLRRCGLDLIGRREALQETRRWASGSLDRMAVP